MLKNKQVECIIMDWAGTAVDFGCFAPVNAFTKAFEEIAIEITATEVRIPMGMAKIEHIRQLLGMDRITGKFENLYNRHWNEEDVTKLYQSFEKHLFTTLSDYTDPIPHVINTIGILRQNGLKIGSTTGYTQAMMDIVASSARSKGYAVDNFVTPDNLPTGRPAPFMIYRNMIDLNVQNTDYVVKVGDTMEDIREGLNAKVWTIGVIVGSSELGLSEIEIMEMPEAEVKEKINVVKNKILDAGAHYTIETMAELPAIIEQINKQLRK